MSKPLGGPFEVLWYHVTNAFVVHPLGETLVLYIKYTMCNISIKSNSHTIDPLYYLNLPSLLQTELPLVHSAFRISGYCPSQASFI